MIQTVSGVCEIYRHKRASRQLQSYRHLGGGCEGYICVLNIGLFLKYRSVIIKMYAEAHAETSLCRFLLCIASSTGLHINSCRSKRFGALKVFRVYFALVLHTRHHVARVHNGDIAFYLHFLAVTCKQVKLYAGRLDFRMVFVLEKLTVFHAQCIYSWGYQRVMTM